MKLSPMAKLILTTVTVSTIANSVHTMTIVGECKKEIEKIETQVEELAVTVNKLDKTVEKLAIDVNEVKIIEDNIKIELEEEPLNQINLVSLGNFKLTAYCSCRLCCGKYAYNRPKDENGKEIVYGSIGERLVAGSSIAVDPKVIPYGTEVVIDGHTYIAQDTGGSIKGNHIDVYHDNHKAALNFGVKTAEVFMVAE